MFALSIKPLRDALDEWDPRILQNNTSLLLAPLSAVGSAPIGERRLGGDAGNELFKRPQGGRRCFPHVAVGGERIWRAFGQKQRAKLPKKRRGGLPTLFPHVTLGSTQRQISFQITLPRTRASLNADLRLNAYTAFYGFLRITFSTQKQVPGNILTQNKLPLLDLYNLAKSFLQTKVHYSLLLQKDKALRKFQLLVLFAEIGACLRTKSTVLLKETGTTIPNFISVDQNLRSRVVFASIVVCQTCDDTLSRDVSQLFLLH
ncbi:uncharacterized protein LOC132711178 [Pantherophis guttatus]|uniref:Uncharacterized protein LOC132711178 n=1 Tax=Pantherophis guttatus TaxID=94885 RepID=A0ABM3ZB12_PANGU|nr:uncharacterized protein LOC132711178 [Pantherophis guttatus]